MTTRQQQLYFSADELRLALKDLGPPGDKGEALIATAAYTLAELIDDQGVVYAWTVEHYGSAEAARQGGNPHVVLSPAELEVDWEGR